MPVIERITEGQVEVTQGGSVNFLPDGALLLNGHKVTASAQVINALTNLINADGEIELVDTTWDDLRFPAAGINPPGGASDPDRDTEDGRLAFASGAVNGIAVQVQMPHSWKEGSAIEPHVHWSPTSTDTGNVVWRLDYKIANRNEAFPESWSTLTITVPGDGVTDKHQMDDFEAIDMTGKTISCMLLMKLARMGNDGNDTYADDAKLNEFDIHYEIDGFGSDEEHAK